MKQTSLLMESGKQKEELESCWEEYKYVVLDENHIEITKYRGNVEKIEIPSKINKRWVIGIGSSAFSGCRNLKSIELPGSVTSIGDCAFSQCSSLISIKIPEGVTSIEDGTFSECSSLISVELPKSVTSIGDWAFSECRSLCSIELPEGVTCIGRKAFAECVKLNNVRLPESVASIGIEAFYVCACLSSIKFPENIEDIGGGAFEGTPWLCNQEKECIINKHYLYRGKESTVIVPYGIKTVDFVRCSDVQQIILPDSVISIAGAFMYCRNLSSIELPKGLTSIGDAAFAECWSLSSIKLPKNVTSIGNAAFISCWGLDSIELPESVKSIGGGAFFECRYVTAKVKEGSYAEQYMRKEGISYVTY